MNNDQREDEGLTTALGSFPTIFAAMTTRPNGLKDFFNDWLNPNSKIKRRRQTIASLTPSSPTTSRTRVALQNTDPETDAVVITALDRVPFCCHEDLLTMTRLQLEAVARAFNDKLPQALQIDFKPERTDVFIRNSIEVLVGLKRSKSAVSLGLPARKRDRDGVAYTSDRISVVKRSRPHNMLPPRVVGQSLDPLQEEDCEEMTSLAPPPKKRRLSGDLAVTAPRRVTESQGPDLKPQAEYRSGAVRPLQSNAHASIDTTSPFHVRRPRIATLKSIGDEVPGAGVAEKRRLDELRSPWTQRDGSLPIVFSPALREGEFGNSLPGTTSTTSTRTATISIDGSEVEFSEEGEK
jgi:hypothetical protein